MKILGKLTANECVTDSFTIRAVSQDDFEDVQVPDKPIQGALTSANTNTSGTLVK